MERRKAPTTLDSYRVNNNSSAPESGVRSGNKKTPSVGISAAPNHAKIALYNTMKSGEAEVQTMSSHSSKNSARLAGQRDTEGA